MAEKIFKERFGNIKKIKICTTTADIDFDTYTEPGTYEIYEDMGNGQSRIYFLTVDKSVSGACLKQTRIHCGIVDARQSNSSGAWTAWEAVTGGGSPSGDYVTFTDYATADKAGVVKTGNEMQSGIFINNGVLGIFEALEGDLGSSYSAVITTKILDKAVKFVGDGYYATAEEVGDISSALDELHAYAQALINGGAE